MIVLVTSIESIFWCYFLTCVIFFDHIIIWLLIVLFCIMQDIPTATNRTGTSVNETVGSLAYAYPRLARVSQRHGRACIAFPHHGLWNVTVAMSKDCTSVVGWKRSATSPCSLVLRYVVRALTWVYQHFLKRLPACRELCTRLDLYIRHKSMLY